MDKIQVHPSQSDMSNLRPTARPAEFQGTPLDEQSLAQIEQAKQEWEATVDSLPQFVCLLNQQGHLKRANRTVERWRLGQVNNVKGQELHALFHPGCQDPDCYLQNFWTQAQVELVQKRSVECEAWDEVLGRQLHFQIRPISTQTRGIAATAESLGVVVVQDVTRRKQVEHALQQAHDELEQRVQTRTLELANANAELRLEIAERQQAEAENLHLHTQTETRARELAILNKTGQTLTSTLDLDTILELIVTEANALFQAEVASVLLLEPAGNELVIAAVATPGSNRLRGTRIPVTGNIAGRVVEQKQTILLEDVRQETGPCQHLEVITGLTPRSLMVAPLISKHKVIGVVEVVNKAGGSFDEHDLEILETLAGSAAIAIENARLFDQVQTGHEQLRQLAQRVVAAQEEERYRLSHELHDEAGQALTALSIQLKLIQSALPAASGEHRQRLGELVALTNTTLERIRGLARDLRPPALEVTGLNPALEGLCHDFAGWTELTVDYRGFELDSLPDPANICLYRFLQEALTNIAKHARANQVQVTLQAGTDYVSLLVADDGRGFDRPVGLTGSKQPKGLGLLGMQERLELLGGRLEVETRPGHGACLTAYLPREEYQ